MKKNQWLLLLFSVAMSMGILMGCSSSAATDEEVDEGAAAEETGNNDEKETSVTEMPDGFRVTTIGAGSPSTYNTKTWSSTLVQFQDHYFLVDCGAGCTNGIAQSGIKPSEIDNILFTHHHADHNSDFLTILIAGWATDTPRQGLNLIGTKGTQKFYDFAIDFYKEDIQYRIDAGFTSPRGIIDNVEIQEVEGGEEFELDGVKISVLDVPHSIKTVAYKFEAGGKTLVLTGDTKYNEELIEFSKDADFVVMDGMLTEVKEGDPYYEIFQRLKPNLSNGHITLEEIGKTAAEANYKTMVLNHLFNGEMDKERTIEVLREQGYEGEVIIAETRGSYEVE